MHRASHATALAAALLVLATASAGAATEAAWEPETTLGPLPTARSSWSSDVDEAGNVVVAVGTRSGRSAGLQVYSRGPGDVFGGPVAVSAGDAISVDVALAGAGAGAVAWVRQRGVRAQVRAIVRGGGGAFSAPRGISSPGARDLGDARVAVDDRGDAVVVWVADLGGRGRTRVQAAYRRAGGRFGRPRTLSPALAFAPAVAMGSDGSAVIAWHRSSGDGEAIHALTVSSRGGFGRSRELGEAGATSQPSVAAGDGGVALVAWAGRLRDRQGHVLAAQRYPGHGFGIAQELADDPPLSARADAVVAIGPGGRLQIAWEQDAAGSGSRIWGAHDPGVGIFDDPTPISGPVAATYATDPSIAFTPDGGRVVAWLSRDASGTEVQVATARGDRPFAPPAMASGGPGDVVGGSGLAPRVAIDGVGAPSLFWTALDRPSRTLGVTVAHPALPPVG